MEAYLKEITDKILMLPSDDRAYLANVLLESLSRGHEVISDEEYAEDMRRLQEADEHPETTVSWEEIKQSWDAGKKAS